MGQAPLIRTYFPSYDRVFTLCEADGPFSVVLFQARWIFSALLFFSSCSARCKTFCVPFVSAVLAAWAPVNARPFPFASWHFPRWVLGASCRVLLFRLWSLWFFVRDLPWRVLLWGWLEGTAVWSVHLLFGDIDSRFFVVTVRAWPLSPALWSLRWSVWVLCWAVKARGAVPVCLWDYLRQLDLAVPQFPIDVAQRGVYCATRNHLRVVILLQVAEISVDILSI